MTGLLVMVVIYVVILLGIGWYFSRGIKNFTDYFLAGRNLTIFPLTATLLATWAGSNTVMGFTGYMYNVGYSVMWIAIPTSIGLYIFAMLLASKVTRLRQFTIPDLLEMRYSRLSRWVGGIFISIFSVGMAATNIMAGGRIVEAILDVDYTLAVTVTTLIVVIYTVMGGMAAVTWTDTFQWIWLTIGFIVGVPFLLSKVGGWPALHAKIGSIQPFMLDPMAVFDVKTIIAFFLVFTLPFIIDPTFYQRCFAAKDARIAKIGVILTAWWDAFLTLVAMVVALSAVVLFGPGEIQGDLSFPLIIKHYVPGFLGAFLVVALIAAIMSSADSNLLQAGGTIARDYYASIKKNASEKSVIMVSKISVVVTGLIALVMALKFEYILDAAIFSLTVFTAGAFVPVFMAFFSKRGNEYGTIASMIGGGGLSILWSVLGEPYGIDAVIPGVLLSVILYFGVSLITTPPTSDKLAPFAE